MQAAIMHSGRSFVHYGAGVIDIRAFFSGWFHNVPFEVLTARCPACTALSAAPAVWQTLTGGAPPAALLSPMRMGETS